MSARSPTVGALFLTVALDDRPLGALRPLGDTLARHWPARTTT